VDKVTPILANTAIVINQPGSLFRHSNTNSQGMVVCRLGKQSKL
jgi:hypothetical protein